MKKLAKILVLVLSVALVFGAIAMAVSAENETCKIGDASYATLAEALAAAQTEDTITLVADISVDASITLNGVNLDLGGYKVTGTGAGALFVTNGNVTIANGSVESASELLFNVQSGELTVNTLSGFASLPGTNYKGVSSLPECYTAAEGASFVNADDSDVKVRALYQVNHSDGTVTYFGTAEEFTQLWSYSTSSKKGYYLVKSGDTIVMNGDITFTGNLDNTFPGASDGLRFTLDVNGHKLDTLGYDLVTAKDKNTRGATINFTIKSSQPGGEINSTRHAKSGAGEALVSDPLLFGFCGGKVFNIEGAVDGVTTLTINTGCLFVAETFGSNDCGSTHLVINGGMYNMVGFAESNIFGFISLNSGTNPSGKLIPNAGDVTINNATVVQAGYSPKDTNGIHGTLDYNDGQSSVNYYVTELFHFGGPNDLSTKANETKLSTTDIICTNSTIVGRTPDSQVTSSRLLTGQVTYNNCKVSADIAPKDCKYMTTNDFSGRGRVVIDDKTVFSSCSKAIVDYNGGAIGGVFFPKGVSAGSVIVRNINAPSIPLPNAASAIDRGNVIAIRRPWIVGGSNSFNNNAAGYGVYNANAGYYFLAEYGVAATDIVTEADIAASYTYNGVTESAPNKEDRLVINLGKAEYSMATAEAFESALFYIQYKNGAYAPFNTVDDWKKVLESYVVNQPTASGSVTISDDALYGMTLENTVDVDGDGKITVADYDGRYNSILENGAKVVLQGDITYTGNIRGQLGELSDITFDLNGHTIDMTKSYFPFLYIGSGRAGKGNGNHNDSIGITITSSVPGAKVVTNQTSSGKFLDILGDAKYVDIIGSDDQGNVLLTVETPMLIFQNTIASGDGDFDAYVHIKGGHYIHTSGNNDYAFIQQRADSSNGKKNLARFTMENATIEGNSTTAWIMSQMRSSEDGATNTVLTAGATFNGCVININTYVSFGAAGYKEANIYLNNTIINGGSSIGNASAGHIVIGEGCQFNGFKVYPKDYDADAIADYTGNTQGVYLAAEGLHAIKTVGETKYSVSNAEAKQVTWTIGETVTSGWYLADADVTADFPAPTIYNNEIIQQTFEWITESENNYVGKTTTAYANYNLSVSTTLYSNLAINVYLSEAYAKNYAGELEFVPSDEEGIWVATVALNGNEAFTAVVDSLSFATADGFKVTLTLNNPINLYNYVGMIISDEDMSVEERDLMWYMVDYLKNAYKVITLSEKEIAALGAEDEATAKATADSKFAELLALYEKRDITVSAEAYAGEALGVDIFVDLTSAPRFVFKASEGSTVTAVSVNGIALEANERGEFFFEIENVHQFDQTFTVTTELGTGSVKLANYYAAALAEDTDEIFVAETVEALYKYVLAAQTFKASLTPSAE